MTDTVHAAAPASSARVSDAYRWTQLAVGVAAMVMIANYQYGWTFFVPDIQKKFGWDRASIQWAFTLFVLFETWLVPIEGWFVDKYGPRIVVLIGGILCAIGWAINAQATSLNGFYLGMIIAGIGAGGVYPEGRFLPETYSFVRGQADIDVLKRAYKAMQVQLARRWAERDPALPLGSPDELLTLASIVEKETGRAPERPRIAGVFVRRLKMPMMLQTDPTVIYGLGDSFNGNLTRKHLETDTPYNTYTRFGLPPTPIALPGDAALAAVAKPANGEELYFVAKGNGEHAFSATLAEHNRAVRDYQLR